MDVLVTGWTGFLGGAVARELALERHLRVLGVARTLAGGTGVPAAGLPAAGAPGAGASGAGASGAGAASAGPLQGAHVASILPVFGRGNPFGVERHVADLSGPGAATRVLDELRPQAVVHLAALASIAACRADPALAQRTNAELPAEIARWCAAHGARLAHVSTDQVFDGSRGGWREDDEPRPLHGYGASKLAGERAVLAACPGAVVLRAALITGREVLGGRSASGALLSALAVGDEVRLFTDEIRTPVAVADVARALADLIERPEVTGVLHCGGPRALSRHALGLAEAEAAELDSASIVAITRAEAGLAAERPADLSLDSRRLVALLGWTPRMLA